MINEKTIKEFEELLLIEALKFSNNNKEHAIHKKTEFILEMRGDMDYGEWLQNYKTDLTDHDPKKCSVCRLHEMRQ
jgi:hypothetical protein